MGSSANLRMKNSARPAPGLDCDERSMDRAQSETVSNRSGQQQGQRKWLLLLILVAGIVAWFLVQKKVTRTEPLFRTTKVTRGDIRQTVTATGEIDPIESVTIGCQISGQISTIFVTYNDQVKKGQVIAEIDPASYKAALADAEGNLANAEAARDLARIQAKRQEDLLRKHTVAPSDYDQAITTLKQDEAQVKMRQADLEKARVDLEHCTIYSPIAGIVISKNIDVGQTVAATLSSPTLFVIDNELRRMQIVAKVSEADIGGVREGQPVDFAVDAYADRTFHGIVTQVRNATTITNNVVTYDTVIGVANDDLRLKPGMTANVSIVIAEKHDVLKLANAALRFRPSLAAQRQSADGSWGNLLTRQLSSPNRITQLPGQEKAAMASFIEAQSDEQNVRRQPVFQLIAASGTNELKPQLIVTGISDSVSTELVQGLNEGDEVITGILGSSKDTPPGSPMPFGAHAPGGMPPPPP